MNTLKALLFYLFLTIILGFVKCRKLNKSILLHQCGYSNDSLFINKNSSYSTTTKYIRAITFTSGSLINKLINNLF